MGEKKFFFRLNAEHAALMVAIIEIMFTVQVFINKGLIAIEKSQCVEDVSDKVEDEDGKPNNMLLHNIIYFLIVMIFDVILLIVVLWGKRNLIMFWIVFGFIRISLSIIIFIISWKINDLSISRIFFCICINIYKFIWTSYSMYVLISACRSRSTDSPSNQIAMNIAS